MNLRFQTSYVNKQDVRILNLGANHLTLEGEGGGEWVISCQQDFFSSNLGRVVWKPVNVNPELNVNWRITFSY